jgi:hypothetical protein
VAKRVSAGARDCSDHTMEELQGHAFTCRSGEEDCITTLAKAIKSGRLSVSRKEDGSYEIDPAELARVYSFSAPGETATASVLSPSIAAEEGQPVVQLLTERPHVPASKRASGRPEGPASS